MEWQIVLGVASLLLAGNLYFVKRLVDKVENNSASNSVLSLSVTGIGTQLNEIKSEIKDLRKIEIEVAVLKSRFLRIANEGG